MCDVGQSRARDREGRPGQVSLGSASSGLLGFHQLSKSRPGGQAGVLGGSGGHLGDTEAGAVSL